VTYQATTTDQSTGPLAGSTHSVEWPVHTGLRPALADQFFSPRPETGHGLDAGLEPGEPGLADPGGNRPIFVLTGPSGHGKTHLAAARMAGLSRSGAAELQAWINASNQSAVLAGYAQAALDLSLTERGAPADASAARFRDWLSRTDRRWIVVFDNATDLAALGELWPTGPNGQVVVTCHPSVTGADLAQLSDIRPRLCQVDVFSPR